MTTTTLHARRFRSATALLLCLGMGVGVAMAQSAQDPLRNPPNGASESGFPIASDETPTAFLHVKDIPGDANEYGHVNWIVVTSFHVGLVRSSAPSKAGVSFEFTHAADKSDALFWNALATRATLSEVQLDVMSSDAHQIQTYNLNTGGLGGALVFSIDDVADFANHGPLMQTVTLNNATMSVTTSPYYIDTGHPAPSTTATRIG